MAAQRTAAQAAQDKNKDKAGKFQHGTSAEANSVQLSVPTPVEELKNSLSGVEALSSLSAMSETYAAKAYLDQLSSSLKKSNPNAASINFSFEPEHEEGLVARFDSVTDSEGNELEVDQEIFGRYGHEAFVYKVDATALQNRMDWEEDEDGNAIYTYEIAEKDDKPFARQLRAENYGHDLLLMAEVLSEQRANAAVSVAMHNVVERFPGLEEVTLGRSIEPGRSAQVDSFVQNGKRFERPRNATRYDSPDGIEWSAFDRNLDNKVDFSSMFAKPVDVQEALNWSPGQSLIK